MLMTGISCGLGGTTMRVCASGAVRDEEIYARDLVFLHSNGDSRRALPLLTRCSTRDACGVLGALNLQSLKLDGMCSDQNQFKFLFLRFDGAKINESSSKYVIAETQSLSNLLIITNVCWYHTIRNSVLWSIGDTVFGPLLRTSRVLESLRGASFGSLLDEMEKKKSIIANTTLPFPADRNLSFGAASLGFKVWPRFMEIVLSRDGPFARRTEILEELISLAQEIFPGGIPTAGFIPDTEFFRCWRKARRSAHSNF